MEETYKDNDVPRYPDASLKTISKSVKRIVSEYFRDLSKKVSTSETDPEKFDSSNILSGNRILHNNDNVIKNSFGFSAVGGRRDSTNKSLSTEGHTEPDLSIDNFQARDGKKSPRKTMVTNLNILQALQESGKMSDLFKRSRSTSDIVSSTKIRKYSQCKNEDIAISHSKTSHENVVDSANNIDKDVSPSAKQNLTTFPTVSTKLDSESSISSSKFKMSENDSISYLDDVFAGEYCGKYENIMDQQGIFNRDFMSCDSDSLSNSANNSVLSTKLSASLIPTTDDRDHKRLTSQHSEDTNNDLYPTFSDANPRPLENFKTSETLKPDFEISKHESKITHANLKISESDQDLKPDEKSPYFVENTVRDVIKSLTEFQDSTVGSYYGRFNVSDEGMEDEKSANLNTIDDDYDYLNVSISSEDRNEAVQNYLSNICSIPLRNSTFLNNYSDSTNTDLKSSDSDKDSYHSDLMFSGSDNESNHDKRSCDLRELVAGEAIPGMELPSDNDQVKNISEHEAKDEVSTNFIDSDEEALITKALTSSDDPEKVLQDYFSNWNSVPSNALKTSSFPSEYCSPTLTSSDNDQYSNPKKLSEDVLRVQNKVQNLIDHIIYLKQRVRADIVAGVFSCEENSSDIYPVSDASVYEEKEDISSTNSISTTEEIHIVQALISSEDPDTALADYFSSKHSDFKSSDNDEDSNSNFHSGEMLRVLNKVENVVKNAAELRGFLKPRQDVEAEASAISTIQSTSDNEEANIVSSFERKENEMNIISINTDDASDRLEALISSQNQKPAPIRDLSNRNSKPRDPMSSANESEYNQSDSISFDGFMERSSYVSGVGKELRNIATAFQGVLKQANYSTYSEMDLASDYDQLSLPNYSEKRKEDYPGYFDRQNPRKTSEKIREHIKRFFPIHPFSINGSNCSDRGTKTVESGLKFSNREEEMSSFKQSKKGDDEEELKTRMSHRIGMKRKIDCSFDESPCSDDIKRSSIDHVETEDENIETIDEIFKKVIKCHPIRKFEIPPYASANTEEKLWKIDDNYQKHTSDTLQLNGTIEKPNILEHVLNLDSHSIMTFDVTDCFSQNSNIICNGMIREYLDISAKVDLLLVKNIKNISSEEYESRINCLFSLYEELGYISSKFMITINDWKKQSREIKENFAQSRMGSRGMYHRALLKICKHLGYMLCKFTLEKQLELENYEKVLMFHH